MRAKVSKTGLGFAILLAVSCAMSTNQASSREQIHPKASPPTLKIAGKVIPPEKLSSIFQGLSDDGISTFHRWRVDADTTLICMVIDRKEKEFPGGPTNSVIVLNKAGSLLYEQKNVEVRQLAEEFVLRNSRAQLILDTRGDGRGGCCRYWIL